MIYKKIFTTVVANLILVSAALTADTYPIDVSHSSVAFSVKHLVISNVKGNFKEFAGTILYNEANITQSSVNVTIKTASINTDNEKRDAHLRSADFFDAAKYPEITFKSKRVMKDKNGFVAVGDLTMRGVSREISLPFEIVGKVKGPMGKTRIGVQANLKLNRQDYGLSWSKYMDNGGLVAGNDINIELNVEGVRQ